MARQYIEISGTNESNVAAVTATILALQPGENSITLPELDPVTLTEVETEQATIVKKSGGNTIK